MSQGAPLQSFVREGLVRGHSKLELGAKLREAGWPEDDIRSALAAWADVEFAVPVPRPEPYLPARQAFLYLVLFLALYLASFHAGSLLFAFIERAFPDPVADRFRAFGQLSEIRSATAAMLVTLPVFLLLHRHLERVLERSPRHRESRIRKWLTYLTLFVAAGCVVGDLIAVVSNLLSGELTVRFLLKALVVLGLSGAAFGYYLGVLRRDDAIAEGRATVLKPRGVRAFEWVAVAAMIAVGLAGVVVAGSPGDARARRLDQQRLSNLQALATTVELWFQDNGSLPASLEALASGSMGRVDRMDPESAEPYEYRILTERSYELCAVFLQPTSDEPSEPWLEARGEFWRHGAGRHCFTNEVRPSADLLPRPRP